MNTTARRDELLSTIVLDPTLHPVIDDLGALERLVPEAPSQTESLAIFRRQLPGPGAPWPWPGPYEQVRRLILLLAREKGQVERWIDVANALTILTNVSNLALLLLPVRSEDDAWAREQFARNLLRHARRSGDGEDIALARRAVGNLPQRPAHLTLPTSANAVAEMIETMARRVGALQLKDGAADSGAPGVHTLEQADSLKSCFAVAPDLAGLLGGAQHVLALVDGLRGIAEPDAMTVDAIEGGLILAYARLIRLALWPARYCDDVSAKTAARDLVRARDTDPDRLGALWEIAFGQGETVAGQSSRFLNIDEIG